MTGAESFDCNAGQGVTGFEVPEGSALLSVSPVCEAGAADPASYTAPAPEERVVRKGDEGAGRKLEFVIQEMGRETNTLGSKANDAAISQRVVACKAELEKIREQVQNLE